MIKNILKIVNDLYTINENMNETKQAKILFKSFKDIARRVHLS